MVAFRKVLDSILFISFPQFGSPWLQSDNNAILPIRQSRGWTHEPLPPKRSTIITRPFSAMKFGRNGYSEHWPILNHTLQRCHRMNAYGTRAETSSFGLA